MSGAKLHAKCKRCVFCRIYNKKKKKIKDNLTQIWVQVMFLHKNILQTDCLGYFAAHKNHRQLG